MTILIKRVKDIYGWMGNMSAFPIVEDGLLYKTSEALFQAKRFPLGHPVREEIREASSPFSAKLIAKANAEHMTIEQRSEADLELMRLVLKMKLEQHPELKQKLAETGDELIIEDCSNRQSISGIFWGAALIDGTWRGDNWLGRLWQEQRELLIPNK